MKWKVLALFLALLTLTIPAMEALAGAGFVSACADGLDTGTEEAATPEPTEETPTPPPTPTATPEATEEAPTEESPTLEPTPDSTATLAPDISPTPTPEPGPLDVDTTRDVSFSPAFFQGWVEILKDAPLLADPGNAAFATISGGIGYALTRQNPGKPDDCLSVAFAADGAVQTAYISANFLRPMSEAEIEAYLSLCEESTETLLYKNDPLLPIACAPVSAREPTLAATAAETPVSLLAAGDSSTLDDTIDPNFPPYSVCLTPTLAILGNTADTAVFELIFDSEHAAFDKADWTASDPAAVNIVQSEDHMSAQVTAIAPIQAKTVQVKAVLNDAYTATATVELLPSGKIDLSTVVRILDTKVTVNKAKTVGARVPILITQQPLSNFGLKSLAAVPKASPGTQVISAVKLYTQDSKTKGWTVPLQGFEARMCPEDARYLEVNALPGAKNTAGVKVKVLPEGKDASVAANWIFAEGSASLTVVEKYPKITFAVGVLNAFYSNSTALITAKAEDGSKVTITGVNYADAKGNVIVEIGSDHLTLKALKAGSVALMATVALEDYASPYAKGVNTAKVNAKVTDTAPRLKLSPGTVTLVDSAAGNNEARIQLITADAKVPFESGYQVSGVSLSAGGGNVNVVFYSDGIISVEPKADAKSGTAQLEVTFADSAKTVYLPLKVNMVMPDRITPSAKTKAVTVNEDHGSDEKIADIPITLNAANYTLDNWRVVSVGKDVGFDGSALAEAIRVTPDDNRIALSVKDQSKLAALVSGGKDAKYVLNIGSDSLLDRSGKPKTFAVTLTVVCKNPVFSIAFKGKIDIASPGSALAATAKFTGTTSEIADVTLYNSPNNPAEANENTDFKVTEISGNTFKIIAAHGRVIPGVRQNLSVAITLKNSQTQNSWDSGKDKPIAVTPVQTVGKASQSGKEITLYQLTPLIGQAIGLDLLTPASVKLGAVRINDASVAAMKFRPNGGFELERNGENQWTIRFKGGKAPEALDDKPLKASYTLKLELWAEDTYTLNSDGQPMALSDSSGKARSKPTLVAVKVNVNNGQGASYPAYYAGSAWKNPKDTATLSLNFSPYYLPGADPDFGSKISANTIHRALNAIAPFTDTIRTFGVSGELNKLYKIAKEEYGLRIIAGCWIGCGYSEKQVENELNLLADLGNKGLADILVIGSEGLQRGDYTANDLIRWIGSLREKLTRNVPVGVSDTGWKLQENHVIFQYVDVALFTHYPFWTSGGVQIENAMANFRSMFYDLRGLAELYKTRLICSETGWKFEGNANGASVPSPENAARYFDEIYDFSRQGDINLEVCYFEALEEPWKAKYNDSGWGLLTWNQSKQKFIPRDSVSEALERLSR